MKKYITLSLMMLGSACMFSQTVIGRTSYDVQTNNGSKHRLIVYDDATISASWTGSTDFSGALLFNDRGMFFNHRDFGGTWGAYPTTRVETTKTGFGEIITVEDHEVVLAHDGAVTSIQLYKNTALGGTSWSELSGSDDIIGFWPSAYCPEGTNDIYVVNANANPPTELRFSRSDDGGLTWSVLNTTLPYLTSAEGILGLSSGLLAAAETYQIAVYGTDVYVLFGMVNTDLVLLHSPSNGAVGTWTSTVIHNFPIDNYDGLTQTDTNGDFITDKIETTDGYHYMMVTDDGTVHVFSGYAKIYNDGIGSFWSYDYNDAMYMWHWSTGMDEAVKIDLTLDWDNTDGLNDPVAGIGALRTQYRYAGLTSMPGAVINEATGHMYLTYTMPIEYTDLFDDPANFSAQSFRDIFGVYSADGGSTWSTPVNLTNTAELHKENVYLSVNPKVVTDRIHVLWQRDMYPGTAITDGDLVDTNYVMYNAWIPADFGDVVVPPTCTAATGPVGLYADEITSTSATMHWDEVVGSSQYVLAFWNAAAIETVGRKRPTTNWFAASEGVLEPETTYGFRVKNVCYPDGEISPYSATAYFTTLPLKMGEFSKSVMIYPNPSNGNFNLQLNGYENNDADILIVNSVGQTMYQNHITINELVHAENIDISGMPSGIYHVLISNDEKSITKTIVIE